jgi:plasmid maintenance system killer protein
MKKVERLTSSDAIFAPNIANQERNNTIHPSQFKKKEDERNGWYSLLWNTKYPIMHFDKQSHYPANTCLLADPKSVAPFMATC